MRSTETQESTILTDDGREGFAYTNPIWSRDSQTIVSFRMVSVDKQMVHLIRSSPENGGRAQLQSRPYVLPGDPFPKYELCLVRMDEKKPIKPEVEPFEHEWSRPRVRFYADGNRFTYEQIDRGHGRLRLLEVDCQSGTVRNLIDEKSDTFIWTAHTENQSLERMTWLTESNQILYATEKYGWRQLLLIDAESGAELRELTPRGIVLRRIDRVDEANRLVWFSASGREGQDPYFIHYVKVHIDTGELIWLTEGNGTHSISYSPDGRFLIDNYSRVDMGPVH